MRVLDLVHIKTTFQDCDDQPITTLLLHQITKYFVAVLLICFFLLITSENAYGQRGIDGGGGGVSRINVDTDFRQHQQTELRALDAGLLGETIDPHTGSISFRHTDISLPGNSSLSVALHRKISPGLFVYGAENVEFGDWSLDVPRLHTVFPSNIENNWSGPRCTDPNSIFPLIDKYDVRSSGIRVGFVVLPGEYSNGLLLSVPGHGSQQVINRAPNRPTPFSSNIEYVTHQNWTLSCSNADDGGEGFIATSPDGKTYTFDKYNSYGSRPVGYMGSDGAFRPDFRDERSVEMLLASEVRDVNGNWVRYEYDNLKRLKRIHSNDGRNIIINYAGASSLISSAEANGRVWLYEYETRTLNDAFMNNLFERQVLKRVIRPDQLQWTLNLTGMFERPGPGIRCGNYIPTRLSLTHPNGTQGIFDLNVIKHRQSLAFWETYTTLRCQANFAIPPRSTGFEDLYHEPLKTMSVLSKTLSGPDIETSVWTYEYEQDVEAERYNAGHAYAGHPIATSEDDPTNWTKLTSPDGTVTTYYHFWPSEDGPTDFPEGKLDRMEVRDSYTKELLERREYIYDIFHHYGESYVPAKLQYASYLYNDRWAFYRITPDSETALLTKEIIYRDGDSYTSEQSYNADYTSSDYSYGYPVSTKTYSNISTTPRETLTTYEHNTNKWILGLPKTVTQNGRLLTTNYYDPNTGQLTSRRNFNNAYDSVTYNYYGSGAMAGLPETITRRVTSSENRVSKVHSWHRGKPTSVTQGYGSPDAINWSQTIDDNGWVMSQTDPMGRTNSYEYDIMGRLTKTIPPKISETWHDTNISYDFSGGGAVQTIQKGNAITEIIYDSMLRPTRTRTPDGAFVEKEYDALGRVTFTSMPSFTTGSTIGTTTEYDGLGRIISTQESGMGPISYAYLSGHRRQVMDQMLNITTTYYDGYGGPGAGAPLKIIQPEGITTDMDYDIWGNMTRVMQSGASGGYNVSKEQRFNYDNQQRLCRYYTPEAGNSIYAYNDAGEMIAYAKGQANDNCVLSHSSDKVNLQYDGLGRLVKTDFVDPNTPDITRNYNANGQVISNIRGAAHWSYGYDELDNLTSETLAIDGHNFSSQYGYDAMGHMRYEKLPSGRWANIISDDMGRPTSVHGWGIWYYVEDMQYHANGDVKLMRYGNGYEYIMDQTTQAPYQRIARARSTKTGKPTAIDESFLYTPRGRIASITDNRASLYSRGFTYDAAGRLSAASGIWGQASYGYDALGNLRSKTLGARNITNLYDDQASNRLIDSQDSDLGDRLIQYDARGNVTRLGGLLFTYDRSDQPVALSGTNADGDAIHHSYAYDGNLKRVKSVKDGKTRYHIYDASGRVTFVYNATDNTNMEYRSLAGRAYARFGAEGGGNGYLHADYLGTPRAVSHSGHSYNYAAYTPYGETVGAAMNDNHPGFTGHVQDADTGLNYMQARYYDPAIGRFLSIDPVTFMDTGEPGYFNRYSYSFNDPINNIDPDGRCTVAFGSYSTTCPARASYEANPEAHTTMVKAQLTGTVGVLTIAVPGPEDVVLGAAAAKVGAALKGAKGADAAKIDVGSPPVSVGNTPNAARADLDAAGFPGSPTTQTKEVGTLHEGVPGADGPMDVRVMNGQPGSASGSTTGPRIVTTRPGTNDGVKIDGSKFRNNESASQRKAGCHTSLECN